MVQKDGKLKVPIPQEYRAPVGDHASQLVSKIGVEVRTHLPDFSIRRSHQASWSFLRSKVSKDNLEDEVSHELVRRLFEKKGSVFLFPNILNVSLFCFT
ncbi:hypothetical protein CsSME_00041318 [Camellia sinensis var. sinensis]